MGDLFAALITLFVFLLIAPIVILAIVVSLGLAAVGVAISIFFALLGLAIHILFAASPFIVVFGLLYLVLRPSPKRDLARQ